MGVVLQSHDPGGHPVLTQTLIRKRQRGASAESLAGGVEENGVEYLLCHLIILCLELMT